MPGSGAPPGRPSGRSPVASLWAAILGALAAAPAARGGGPAQDAAAGFATITEDEIAEHVRYLGAQALEGRDSPSVGLTLAAEHVAGVFAAAGLEPAPDSASAWDAGGPGGAPPDWSRRPAEGEASAGGSASAGEGSTYLRPYRLGELPGRETGVPFSVPLPEECALELILEGAREEDRRFEYGADFVPLRGHAGDVRGELVWGGYGIRNTTERYDDFRGVDVAGKVVMVLAGEPRHRRKFDGPEVTAEAAVWNKIDALAEAEALGAIVVRRPLAEPEDGEPLPAGDPPLSYRYTWASWMIPSTDRRREGVVPAVEVTLECATALLGEDVEALAAKIDRSGRPTKAKVEGRTVSFRAVEQQAEVVLHNVVGVLPGSDPALREEVVIVGAHYDHVGVDARGRVGAGADDNASGTAALLEVVEAMAAARPPRTVLFAAFSAEEDGLIGSKRLAEALPFPREGVVAMVNLDMIGRGDAREVVCMGFRQNPGMEKVVERANDLAKTGVKKITSVDDPGLFQRSDHFSFHEIGVPVVFFFEAYPLEQNKDYHTWRDTPDKVDMEKVTHTARLAFLTAWILASDEERLPAPER